MTTVSDLYTQVLGRAPDAGGLAYWESMFGPTVDPTELATFKSVAQVTEPTAPGLLTQVDQSSAISAQQVASSPAAGMPTTVTDFYKQFYGSANADPAGVAFWQSKFGGNNINPQQASIMINEASKNNPNAATGLTVEDAFKKYLGGNTDQAGINFWKQQFGNGDISVGQLAQLTNTQSGINTDTSGGGLFGTGIGPNVSFTDLRDAAETAAVIAGNYYLPGSSLVTSNLVSDASKQQLGSTAGQIANLAAGGAGAYQGNLANYGNLAGNGSTLTNAQLDAQFIAADAEQLAAQGLSQAAIEQNLVAAGVDSFVAADAAQLALQGIKGNQLAGLLNQSSGGATSLFTTGAGANVGTTTGNTAGGTGAGTGATTGVGTGVTSGLTGSQVVNLAKVGLTAAGLLGGTKALTGLTGGTSSLTGLPTQDRSGISSGSAQYSPEYYQAIQAKYNQMMQPQQPRDVTTELKNWYETKYAPSVTVTPKVA